MTNRTTVPVLCPHGTVVCIATGPSLTVEDVEACRGLATVVTVNDAHRLAPWADVLYSSDQHWWAYHKGVPTFTGRKVGIAPLMPRSEWGVTVLRNTGDRGIETDPTGLRTGRNSGFAAMNLAVHLGAVRVLLLGYDMGVDPSGKRHFFGNHPPPLRSGPPYASFVAFFEAAVEPLRQLGVEVINCSRQTALTCFPRMAIADALGVPA